MSRGTDQFSKMTPEESRENGRKGGIKSGETKRRKKAMKETLEVLLSMPMKKGKVAETGKKLSKTDLAFRAGYLEARKDSAKAFKKKHPRYKKKY